VFCRVCIDDIFPSSCVIFFFFFFFFFCLEVQRANGQRSPSLRHFSSPPKPFEFPPYASAMADCFAKAESPPPHRVRHFSRGMRNLFLLEAKVGDENEKECCASP
jgi:hypothetical protein